MSQLLRRTLTATTMGLLGTATAAATPPPLHSPDQRLRFSLQVSADQQLHYSVQRNGRPVLLPGRLGLVLDGADLGQGLRFEAATPVRRVSEHYELLVSKRRQHHHLANEATYTVKNAAGQPLQLVVRVANDGVAFRYRAAVPGLGLHRFVAEHTQIRLAPDARAWLQPMQVAKTGFERSNPAYEEHYQVNVPVGTPSPLPAGWVFPALWRSGPDWVAASESGLDASWHASRLAADSTGGVYRLAPPAPEEVMGDGALLAEAPDELLSPWRVLAIGSLRTLMHSTLVTDVAPAPIVAFDKALVQPGQASWSWPILKDESAVFEVQWRFIDYAARMGWHYTLIDAGWDEKIGRARMAELVAHAAKQGVGILLWYNSAGAWNSTPQTPRNLMEDRATRRREFAWLQQAGIKGVKVDFFGGDGRSVIRYYQDILADAAEFGLLVNFHGSTLPRGWQRTWPNLMTMEGVKGFEFTTFGQADQDAVPRHAAMLPFTRNLFDPMDFTPMVFGDVPGIQRRTRNGFELAQAVLFTSGIQHYAEIPEGMASVPAFVPAYLRQIPRHWDALRFISGVPGEHVVIARRAGRSWHVAGLNAGDQPLTLQLDLGFLGRRRGQLITDGSTGPRSLVQHTVQAGRRVPVTLQPQGGFAAVFKP